MIAVIDSGNSSVKLGIFDQAKLIKSYNSLSLPSIKKHLRDFGIDRVVISDVGGRKKMLMRACSGKIKTLWVSAGLKFPIKIKYKSPESLGSDRIAAITGAWHRFGPANILVIDSGTCLTYDFVDENSKYLGGGISPGISMRLKALHAFTSSLPEIDFRRQFEFLGKDTKSSILSGTLGGIIYETEGIIKKFRKKFPDIKIILCGGNTDFLRANLKSSVHVIPDLILWGLLSVAVYNEF